MKIAFIGQKGIPTIAGGVEKHVEQLSVKLAVMGHKVFVYVRNNYTDKNLKEYKGVHLIHLPSVSSKNLDAITHTFLATVHALFQGYDVIHYQAIGPSSLSFLVKIFNPKTALVATFHCQDYFHQKWSWLAKKYLHFGEYMTCKVPDRTIAVGKNLTEYAEKKYEKKIYYIPNGADVTINQNTQVLSRWGIRDKGYILFAGRLIRHKGAHYLIEAFKNLENTSKLPNNFKLVIVGDGFHTDEYVKYLHSISKDRENIIFTKNQTGSALEQLFSHAYLFVQPSESEGLSIALLEAMGYGRAVLVSDIPENVEVIGEIGHTFKSRNVADLENKLSYLLNNPEKVAAAGKYSQDWIAKNYSWDSIAKKTAQLYRELIEKKNPKKNLCLSEAKNLISGK
jgi:glycosyltransferase involved in cell wall biosynthesis